MDEKSPDRTTRLPSRRATGGGGALREVPDEASGEGDTPLGSTDQHSTRLGRTERGSSAHYVEHKPASPSSESCRSWPTAGAGMAGLVAAAKARRARSRRARPPEAARWTRGLGCASRAGGDPAPPRLCAIPGPSAPAATRPCSALLFERLDADLRWLEGLGAPVTERGTGNPLTTGPPFRPTRSDRKRLVQGRRRAPVARTALGRARPSGVPRSRGRTAPPPILAKGGFCGRPPSAA